MPHAVRPAVALLRRAGTDPDRVLLGRFAAGRDPAAFRALVERHGPAVLGVCRRVLGHHQDAEDAFQATFLVLARRAEAVGNPDALAGWLYGVAARVARKARGRRRPAAPLAADPPAPPADAPAAWRELRAVLDDELARLPARFRLPLVLCHLSDLTVDEAAARLGIPAGTVKSRLARGRDRLRAGLARRGFAPAVGSLGLALSAAAAPAAAPPALLDAATTTALGAACGPVAALAAGLVGPPVARAAAGAVGLGSVLAAGLAWAALAPVAAPSPAPSDEAPPRVVEAPAPRVDSAGDPLPPGALARMGSARLHHGDNVHNVIASGDGKLLASIGSGKETVKLWETETGKEVPLRVGAGNVVRVARAGTGLAALVRDGQAHRIVTLPDGPAVDAKGVESVHLAWLAPDGRTVLWNAAGPRNPDRTLSYDLKVTDARTGATFTLWHHDKEPAFAVRFAADGKTAAFMLDPATVEVWDLAGRVKLFAAPAPKAAGFDGFDLSPDGKVLVRQDRDGRLAGLWEVATGRELPRPADPGPDAGGGVALAPDGRTLAYGAKTDHLPVIVFWDYRAGQRLGETPPHPGQAYYGPDTMSYTPDGRRLVGGSFNSVAVWDAATRKPVHDWGGHTDSPWAVAWSPDGSTLATGAGYSDGVGRVWDARTGRKRFDLLGHRAGVQSLAWSPDARLLATNSQDGTARLWDAGTGAPVHTFEFPTGGRGVAFTADGRHLLAAGSKAVHVFDVAGRREVRSVPLASPWGITFLPDPARVLVRVRDGSGRVVDWPAGRDEPAPPGLPGDLKATGRDRRFGLALDAAGCKRFPLAGGPGVVVAELFKGEGEKKAPEAMDADQTPDGRMVAVGYRSGVVVVYEAATAQERFRLVGHAGDVLRVVYSPDGGRLASSGGEHSIVVWDATGGHLPPDPALDPKDVADAWAKLAGADAKAGFAAVRWLAARPAEAVTYLGGRVRPVPAADPKTVAAIIDRLGAPDFADREAAGKELAGLGEQAAGPLAEAARKAEANEVRVRAGRLLAALEGKPAGERLRAVRAVEVLERVGSAEARAVLKTLAGGADGAAVTREAQAALARLGAGGR